jgi:hypothetical protein
MMNTLVLPYNISSGLFGIRHSYSDNYYATDGEDRGCSARDGNMAFNANQVRCSVHSSCQPSFFLLNRYNWLIPSIN